MSDQKEMRFLPAAAGIFTASLALGALAMTVAFDAPRAPEVDGVHASWISDAETVAEQTLEADLIVRVQAVDRAEPRHLWHPMPAGVEKVEGRGTFAFTDTEVEVLEVYHGDVQVGDRLWTMQTGGDLKTREGGVSRLEIGEDPLYRLGDEMVLFLVDISGDAVHAPNRQLYRTVNPAGRFQVEGGLVDRLAPVGDKSLDLDLGTLESQIRAAVVEREALEG